MLEPRERRLFKDALVPPDGYSLDAVIGTTFSLDLTALLTVPLAFSRFDLEDDQGRPSIDPLALLEAIRRYADRINIFCQAGRIAVPKTQRALFGYLEGSVFEVVARNPAGVFHPKVWVLRFVANGEPVRYRVLNLTRNLTFDRSWDAMLVLDGELIERKNAFAANHALGDFIAALPDMAIREFPEQRREVLSRVADELRRVAFELPEGVKDLGYWPLGITRRNPWPFATVTPRLIVSPFVSEDFLLKATNAKQDNILVSRPDSLAPLSPTCHQRFPQTYVLSDEASPEPADEVATTAEVGPEDVDLPLESEDALEGLHAKIFVGEAGWDAHVWVGSANATTAAFERNVEFLVELVGSKKQLGVDQFLTPAQGETGFTNLLREFTPPAEFEQDAVQKALEKQVDVARRSLAAAGLVAKVRPAEDSERFAISVVKQAANTLGITAGVRVICWPVTLRDAAAKRVADEATVADFGGLSFEALTSFFAFDVKAEEGSKSARARFVLNLPLQGAPDDRRERLLRSLLQNRDEVLRYLMFLLAPDDSGLEGLMGGPGRLSSSANEGLFGTAGIPLLESLIHILERSPEKLDNVAQAIEGLNRAQLLPEGFDAVWEPIWAVRRGQANG